MYCPLCKAEYRTGFEKCSDCLVALVPTLEQAMGRPVILLWRGTSQSEFNDIVAALHEANVPTLARSGVTEARKRSNWDYIPILSLFSRYKRMYDQMTWEISVLDSDYVKAREIVANRT